MEKVVGPGERFCIWYLEAIVECGDIGREKTVDISGAAGPLR